jgi:hypothetical protein
MTTKRMKVLVGLVAVIAALDEVITIQFGAG